MGLVASVVEKDDQVVPAALALARKIAKQSSIAVRSTVCTLRSTQDESLERSLWREGPPPLSSSHFLISFLSP